jgi:hypothetical protein
MQLDREKRPKRVKIKDEGLEHATTLCAGQGLPLCQASVLALLSRRPYLALILNLKFKFDRIFWAVSAFLEG